MAAKTDIQATRSDAAAGVTAIIAAPVRLRGIIIASDGGGAGVLELTTTSNTGTTLFLADVPTGAVYIVCSPGETGTAIVKNLFKGATAIFYLNASINGVTSA